MDDGDLIDVVGVVVVDGWVGAAVWAVAMDVAKVSACHRPRSSRRILLLTYMLSTRTEGRRGSDEQEARDPEIFWQSSNRIRN